MKEYKQDADLDALAKEVFDEHEDLSYIQENGLSICFLLSNEGKLSKGKMVLGECKKVPDLYVSMTGFDFIVILYEPWIYNFTPEQKKILLYHELLHAEFDDGKKRIRNHDIVIGEFAEIDSQYGLKWMENHEKKEEPAEASAEEKEEKAEGNG